MRKEFCSMNCFCLHAMFIMEHTLGNLFCMMFAYKNLNLYTSLLNECLWYDKLLGLSQRVVTLFFKVLVVMGAVGWWVS